MEINDIRKGTQQSLLCVLLATSPSECSDPRDKIFGVLSLANDYKLQDDTHAIRNSPKVLEPDYTISPAEVFLRLAQWSIQVYGAPDDLSCTSRADIKPSPELQGLPSWVPDWTRLDVDVPFLRHEFCHVHQQKPIFVSDKPVLINDLGLEVPAIQVDKVRQVGGKSQFAKAPFGFGKPWDDDEERSKVMLKLHKWTQGTAQAMHNVHTWISDCENLASLASMGRPGTRETAERIWRTLTAGMNSKGEEAPASFSHYFLVYKTFLEACISAHRLADSDIMIPWSQIDIVAQVEAALHVWSSKRRFAITDHGRTALVPSQTQEGDVIILVANSKVPHVLRPKDDGSFSVIGEAYLDDIGLYKVTNDATSKRKVDGYDYQMNYYCIT